MNASAVFVHAERMRTQRETDMGGHHEHSITREQAGDFLACLHFRDSAISIDPKTVSDSSVVSDKILDTVRRLGCIQYDPLDVVGRNHDLVLQSRVPGYRPALLGQGLYTPTPRQLVEGIDKMLAIFPVEDWPHLVRTRRRLFAEFGTRPAVEAVLPDVRRHLEQTEGPISSEDLDYDEKVRWPWGATRLSRAALEALWYGGEVILHHRERTRRFYGLTSRLLPPSVWDCEDPFPDDASYFRWHTLRRIRGVGMLRDRPGSGWLGIDGYHSAARSAAFTELINRGELVPVRIEGLPEQKPYHVATQDLPVLERALREGTPREARILAPLDNLIWDRRMVSEIFGFDYTWEVYTPVSKRKYGHYVLPVMQGSRFVARFEPEPHRTGRPLVVRRWWWEPGVIVDTEVRGAIESALIRFAAYLGAGSIEMESPF
jgi:uncharacterized protein YcaQ